MKFQQLLDSINDHLLSRPATDVEITAPVTEDSSAVESGGVFVARKGQNVDGHDLISAAIERGAVAVVGERVPEQVDCPVPYAQVSDSQQVLGFLAAAYYGNPSRQMTVIGVT